MKKSSTYRFIAIGVVFLLSIKLSCAQYAEYELKAAYIFNFVKFIEWPDDENLLNDTIVLGVYKHDPFGIILEKTMIGRKANGKNWKIKRLNNIKDLQHCHIVYFSDVGKYELLQIFESLKNAPTLTIGDEIVDFCESGGMVNFTPQFSEHRFQINNDKAQQSKIKISPKLLLLAKIISISEDEF